MELPRLQELWSELETQRGDDLVLLCANVRDEPKVIVDYWGSKDFTMKAVRIPIGEAAMAFGVKGFPSNFVIAPDGKVRYAAEGWNEKALLAALGGAD